MSQPTVQPGSKFSPEAARAFSAQILVARTMPSNPAQAVKLMMDNPHMFPTVDRAKLDSIIRERGVTREQLDACNSMKF